MVAVARPQRLILPIANAAALAAGGVVALVFLLMPGTVLERLVSASGIPAVLAAAEPPLGFTARIALVLVFGGLAAGFAWFAFNLTIGNRPMDLTAFLRRKSSSGDPAPRQPLSATRELGTPFLEVKAKQATVEQDLPLDLDQPLAAYDPSALPLTPLPVPEPVAPLAQIAERPQLIDPGDRFETFELTPTHREPTPPLRAAEAAPAPVPVPIVEERVVAPITETTVNALLARLERGIAQRAGPVAEAPAVEPAPVAEVAPEPPVPAQPTIRAGSLEDTLGDLRRMATGTR